MARQFRIDRMDAQLEAPIEGPGGCLLVKGIAARPGIYRYRNADGSIRRELVPRKTLIDSAASLGRAPVTLEHPSVMVTDKNVDEYGVGDVDGHVVIEDNGFVKVSMAIRRKEAKDALIEHLKDQLSPGYLVDVLEESGEDPEFGHYDAIQVFRDYNHLAMVEDARGGSECSIRVDSADSILIGGPEIKMSKRLRIDTAEGMNVLGEIHASLGKVAAAKALADRLITDSLAERVQQARDLREFWEEFYLIFDAFHAEVNDLIYCVDPDEELNAQDTLMELERIARELATELSRMSIKLDETVDMAKCDAAAPPPKDPNAVDPKAPPADPAAAAPPADPKAAAVDPKAPPADPAGDPAAVAPANAKADPAADPSVPKPPDGGIPEGKAQPPQEGAPAAGNVVDPTGQGTPAPGATDVVPGPDGKLPQGAAPAAKTDITPEMIDSLMAKHITALREDLKNMIATAIGGGSAPVLDRSDSNRTLADAEQRVSLVKFANRIGVEYNKDTSNGDLAQAIIRVFAPGVRVDSADSIKSALLLAEVKADTIERIDPVDETKIHKDSVAPAPSPYGTGNDE